MNSSLGTNQAQSEQTANQNDLALQTASDGRKYSLNNRYRFPAGYLGSPWNTEFEEETPNLEA